MTANEDTTQLIEPYETTPVEGTPFEVWHDGDEESSVRVLDDGSISLYGGPTWRVKVATR